jgi:hypothetical protein
MTPEDHGQDRDVLAQGPPPGAPDQAAVERVAKALCHADRMRHKDDSVEMPMWTDYLADAETILRAALDPDARPEMPPETRHA